MTEGKKLYSVDEVLESKGGVLPMSKSGLYKMIRENRVPSIRLGGRVFILGYFFDEMFGDAKKQ